jgi:hypothetical protein
MKKVVGFVFAAALIGCGGGGGDACSTLKVAGGEECYSDRNPVVLLSLNEGEALCSGTIITQTSVLTAAHCVAGTRAITVSHRNATEAATEAYFNSRYSGGVGAYDLAVVKVSTAFTAAANFAPLPLQLTSDVAAGAKGAIFGFGRDENGNVSVEFPRAGFLELIGTLNGMITATVDTSFGLPGDSGGPLVYDNAILGVFSGYRISPPLNFFANPRLPGNLDFLRKVASDTAVKNAESVAISWVPARIES